MNRCKLQTDCKDEARLVFIKNGYRVIECKKCGRRFVDINDPASHISKVYSDEYFFEGNSGYPNYLEEKDILIKVGSDYAKIIEKYSVPGKVLDVGCAAGFIMKGFENNGWKTYGIEPNNTMAEHGRTVLKLDIQNGGLETYNSTNTFDLITLIQVIGHFYNVDKAMRNVSNLLNSNGMVLVESWNMNSLYARILGKHWHEYSPPSVINWFSHKSLIKLFNDHGFELIETGYPVKRIRLKHAFSLLQKDYSEASVPKRFFNLLSKISGDHSVIYPPFDLKWYLFRKI